MKREHQYYISSICVQTWGQSEADTRATPTRLPLSHLLPLQVDTKEQLLRLLSAATPPHPEAQLPVHLPVCLLAGLAAVPDGHAP
jgi:hypothetical protein